MDPAWALRQIAFQLERTGAPIYRVRAFRRAAEVVAGLSPDELAERLRAGTLQELAGIGEVTAQVTQRMIAAIRNPHTDVLGHCTGRIITGRGRPSRCSPPAATTASRWRSTAVPSARTRPMTCCGWPSRSAACSRSIPRARPRPA